MRILNIFLVFLILFLNTSIFSLKAEAFSFKRKKPVASEQTLPIEQPITEPVQSFIDTQKYNPKDLIKEFNIEGNSLVPDEQILEVVKGKVGTPYKIEDLKTDLQNIYNMGYFTKNIKAVPNKTDSGVIIKIVVQENIPITGFSIEGNSVLDESEILSVVNKNIGTPQNINVLNNMIEQIEDLYASKGYSLARIKNIQDEPDGNIDIKIDEGYIDDIKISGNIKTKDFVIKRNMMIKNGDIYNELALADDVKRIFGTKAFSDVRRIVSPSENNPEKYCVKIEVDEKRSGSISLGGGLDTGAGLFGSAGFTDYNFRGMGQQLGVDFMSGSGIVFRNDNILRRASYQAEVRFFDPAFLQSKNSLQAKIFGRDYASWQVPLATERRFGTEIEVMRPLEKYKHLSGGVTLGLENVKVKEGDEAQSKNDFATAGIDFSKRANMLTGGTFISLGPKLVYDTRDNMLAPRDGVFASLSAKESLAISGSDTFGRAEVNIQTFHPVGEKSTFALMGKAGTNFHGDAPYFAQYHLGGLRSIRGFTQGAAGNGLGMMMATAELRTPVPFMDKITENTFFNDMRLVAFMDAGKIISPNIVDDVYKYPGYGISAGLGLRIYIPGLGPIKLDYGYPLSALGGGKAKVGRFLFDIGEMY